MSRAGKYVSRCDYMGISKSNYNLEEDFIKNLNKNSVHSRKQDISFIDQINTILGNTKAKYSTVEEAVKDYQKRTGLQEFLSLQSNAQLENADLEEFKNIPEMKTFIDNYIEENPGSSIEAVLHSLLKLDTIRKKMGAFEISENIKKYINDKLTEVQKLLKTDENNINLGKTDTSDINVIDDPLAICMPAKIQ